MNECKLVRQNYVYFILRWPLAGYVKEHRRRLLARFDLITEDTPVETFYGNWQKSSGGSCGFLQLGQRKVSKVIRLPP